MARAAWRPSSADLAVDEMEFGPDVLAEVGKANFCSVISDHSVCHPENPTRSWRDPSSAPSRGEIAAIVLAGEYVEAGDSGPHRAGPEDVILHN